MIIKNDINEWQHKGHVYGECMSCPDSDLMYVYIPKNASSWTKPNLRDWGWEFYNYHTDGLNKTAIVVLRDPVERWLSGIAEYFALYQNKVSHNESLQSIIFDRITFDDHTEKQVKFIQGLDTDRCIFLWCDDRYRINFSNLVREHLGDNQYNNYEYQHVSEQDRDRKHLKEIFKQLLYQKPEYLERVKQHFANDYKLIEQTKFYGR
jgi:hypothetical protein